MSEAPERIFRNCRITGEIDAEYIRADHVDALLKAEREKALREAADVAQGYGSESYAAKMISDSIRALAERGE